MEKNPDDSAFVGVRVSVERGQRGGYGWKLSAAAPIEVSLADAFHDAIDAVKTADERMRREFLSDDLAPALAASIAAEQAKRGSRE